MGVFAPDRRRLASDLLRASRSTSLTSLVDAFKRSLTVQIISLGWHPLALPQQHRGTGSPNQKESDRQDARIHIILERKKRITSLGAMHMIKNGQLDCPNGQAMAAAE